MGRNEIKAIIKNDPFKHLLKTRRTCGLQSTPPSLMQQLYNKRQFVSRNVEMNNKGVLFLYLFENDAMEVTETGLQRNVNNKGMK